MRITFYGVRGSIPAPGAHTVKYGGNTACVFIQFDGGKHLILDAGTGIRMLGPRLMTSRDRINVYLSHVHWDHIQGFPFFAPIYQPGRQIRVYPNAVDGFTTMVALLGQMDGASFPVHRKDLPSDMQCVVGRECDVLTGDGIQVATRSLNHPGGGRAFRIEQDGVSCAYVTDNELEPPYPVSTRHEEWVDFCKGADVLIHDAQYVEADMPRKHGWGHSVVSQVWRLALDAGVGSLVLFHHDPDRSDRELDQIQAQSETFFSKQGSPTRVMCAWEGLVLDLRPRRGRVRGASVVVTDVGSEAY
jgi:phosphoribosyl 1,2-cyclic phosphodiesterase